MIPSNFSFKAVLFPLGVVSAVCAGEPGGRLELKRNVEAPEGFEGEGIEVEAVPAAANPFAPESIKLDLEAVAPSGKSLHVPGFYHDESDRKMEGKGEVLIPRGQGGWRIRWLPLEAGRHALV